MRVLADSPFRDGIVLFNGSNTDDRSKQIYAAWLERYQGTDRVTRAQPEPASDAVSCFSTHGNISRGR